MSRLTPYQFSEPAVVTGLVTDNHFGKMFGNRPNILKKAVTRLLGSAGVRNLNTTLDKFPTETIAEEGMYHWDVTGDSETNEPLVEARENGTPIDGFANPDTMYGAMGKKLQLVFANRSFSDVHLLVGERNELYQFRVTEDPVLEGTLWVYDVELMGGNRMGVPGEELATGKRFSKDFSPVSDTLSTKGGEISISSPFKLGNETTTIRIEHKVAGKNMGKVVTSPIIIKRGNEEIETNTWMQAVEWQLEKTWSYEKAHALAFARSNKSDDGRYYNIGKSGYYIKQGMGLREQQEVNGAFFYDKFNLGLIESSLFDIGEGVLGFEERTVTIRTGERGAALLSKEIGKETSGWTSLSQNNPAVFRQTSSEFHPNAFVAGYQFTEWIAPMGYHVKIEVDPMYDSKVRNKIKAPALGGGVLESYRFDIYMIGNPSSPNIYKVEVEGGDSWGYMWGTRNPFTGARNNENMGTKEDGAEYTRQGSLGIAVIDAGRCITLLPSGLQ